MEPYGRYLARVALVFAVIGGAMVVGASYGEVTASGGTATMSGSAVGESNAALQQRSPKAIVAEHEAIIGQFATQDTYSLYQAWIDADRVERDLGKQYTVGALLTLALQKEPSDTATIQDIREFIVNKANPVVQRSRLLQVLGQAGTRETMDILIEAATSSPDETLRQVAAQCISFGTSFRGDGGFHEELSPALENVWSSSSDEHLLASVAKTMGTVGAPSGVALLVTAALDSSPQNAFRARVAGGALLSVRNPNAIAGLAARLSAQSTSNNESAIASSTLVAIGKPEAVRPLIHWLQDADSDAASIARRSAAKSRIDSVLHLWESALDPAVGFHSEDVREGIRLGLADIKKRYRREPRIRQND